MFSYCFPQWQASAGHSQAAYEFRGYRFLVDILYNSTAREHVQFFAAWENRVLDYVPNSLETLLGESIGGDAYEDARLLINENLHVCAVIDGDFSFYATVEDDVFRRRRMFQWMLRSCHRRCQRYEHWRAIVRIMLAQIIEGDAITEVLAQMRIQDA